MSFFWWLDSSFVVNSHHDWVEFILELLLHSSDDFTFSLIVSFEPHETFFGGFGDGFLVLVGEGILESWFINGVLDSEAVMFKSVLGLDSSGNGIILSLVFLGIVDHLFDVFW